MIFQRLTRIQRILYGKPLFENEISCLKVWKVEQPTTSSLCLKNRRNSRQNFDKNMKKNQKVERKLILAATPSLSGGGGGREILAKPPPILLNFSTAKIFERLKDIWTKAR